MFPLVLYPPSCEAVSYYTMYLRSPKCVTRHRMICLALLGNTGIVKYPYSLSTNHTIFFCFHISANIRCTREKRKRSDSVLWQKPLHQRKCRKGKVTTQTTPQNSSITQRLRTDLGRSVGVTTATQLVWLTGLGTQPSHSPQQPCNQRDMHLKIVNKPPDIDNKQQLPQAERS